MESQTSSGENPAPWQERTGEGAETSHHGPGLDWVRPVTPTNCLEREGIEALLVGRFDGPAAGDLLMPHVISRLLHFSRLRCGSMHSGDYSRIGGHVVRNYGECALEMGEDCSRLVHVGGDILSDTLSERYPASIDEDESDRFASLLEIARPEQIEEYVRRRTGQLDDFAYVLAPRGKFSGAGLCFHAVGFPEPDRLEPGLRSRLVEMMKAARFVGIRDQIGAAFLEKQGVTVERMPCGLVVLPQVCARALRQCRGAESLRSLHRRFPHGWIAVETPSELELAEGDRLAEALAAVSRREGCGIVFFDGNCQPDGDISHLENWAAKIPGGRAGVFRPDSIWEVASLILHARQLCASSVEMRSIAMSGAIPRVAIPVPGEAMRSYCDLWEHFEVATALSSAGDWEAEIASTLSFEPHRLRQHASRLHDRYFASFRLFCRETEMEPGLLPGGGGSRRADTRGEAHHSPDELFGDRGFANLLRRFQRARSPGQASTEEARQQVEERDRSVVTAES